MSVRFIKQNFLLGVGPSMFNERLVEELRWDEARATYEAKGFINKNVLLDPHNTYLGWAAEAGVLFIIGIIAMLFGIIRFMWKGYIISVDSFAGKLSYICMCGAIGFMVNALYIDILTMRHFWLMLGMGSLAAINCLKGKKLA
jgi:O-antigen ligase